MKKPNNYYGSAWDDCEKEYNEVFKSSIEGKAEIEKCKENKKKSRQMYFEQGFDNTECWNLDCTIASFVIDYLNTYKKSLKDINTTEKIKIKEIDKIISVFNSYINYNNYILDFDEMKGLDEALKLFFQQFLNKEIATFILPRLIYLKDNSNGFPNPLTEEQWNIALNKMILSLTNIKENKNINNEDTIEGINLLQKHFISLWD